MQPFFSQCTRFHFIKHVTEEFGLGGELTADFVQRFFDFFRVVPFDDDLLSLEMDSAFREVALVRGRPRALPLREP